MSFVSKPEWIVKILSTILFILFIISAAYMWVQLGHYHFDNNRTQFHVDMHNNMHLY